MKKGIVDATDVAAYCGEVVAALECGTLIARASAPR